MLMYVKPVSSSRTYCSTGNFHQEKINRQSGACCGTLHMNCLAPVVSCMHLAGTEKSTRLTRLHPRRLISKRGGVWLARLGKN